MWFWLAVTALLFWSGSDLFSKIGCRGNDKYAHLKMVIAVGIVMGVHAMYEIFVGGTIVTWHVILTYLPVSLLYISSMTLGYIGLRYIELSISSPSLYRFGYRPLPDAAYLYTWRECAILINIKHYIDYEKQIIIQFDCRRRAFTAASASPLTPP